ncbi:M28 family peptidase [Neobacillus drentensis]|uniref:M28 family peptidase n=1 Tax=Neobacillus drentensis TaxID=220684 RepID=UPI002858E653|nr:M28 family peptidase [Neobacillus drentensis]MDR7238453.1 aminopeptidase YwaD [Neobacillus drentensis]
MFRRKSIITILAASMVLSGGAVYAQSNNTQNGGAATAFDNKVIKKISADNMYNNIALLSEQPRAAGTEGEVRAVNYIESQFKSLGFETEIQPFPIYDNVQIVKVNVGGSDLGGISPHPFSGSVVGKVTAELVNVGKASPNEIGDLTGKIALIERGDLTFIEKVMNVLNKGAVGVLMYNNVDTGNNFGQVNSTQKIPAVAITQAQGQELVQKLKSGQLTATLDVGKMERVEKTSYNVIASLKPNKNKDTGQIVTIGAHHDSVPGGPGANDDASGVSAVLELARIFAKTPIDTEIRFLTFGSEERGLVGSSFYAKSLPKSDVDRMVAHFQMDMIGGRDAGADNPAGGLIMYTIDGKKNLVTDLGAASGARTMSEVIPYGKLGRSDHQPFHELGIPSALFIHSPVEPWYHQPTDTLDKISKEKLQQAAEIVGASVYQIARPDTPALKVARVAPVLVDYDFENRPVQ